MFVPFLELMADAVDTTATLLVLLAVWQGRTVRYRDRLARWLGLQRPARRAEVEDFVREAQRIGQHRPAGTA